jgi:hypothetical protein
MCVEAPSLSRQGLGLVVEWVRLSTEVGLELVIVVPDPAEVLFELGTGGVVGILGTGLGVVRRALESAFFEHGTAPVLRPPGCRPGRMTGRPGWDGPVKRPKWL